MGQKWLTIVGIGEDGLAGLSPIARAHLNQAAVIVGGERHLAMLAIHHASDSPSDLSGDLLNDLPGNFPNDHSSQDSQHHLQEKLVWSAPIAASVQAIVQRRGQAVCVLASGDPLCYGIGVTLLRHIPLEEMTILPTLSAFSLARARLGWDLTEVETLSLCGRDPDLLHAVTYPGAKLLVLSAGRHTPAAVAERLTLSGFGQSQITVLEHLGGPKERRIQGLAATWAQQWTAADGADLNTIAVHCVADAHLQHRSRLAGLPDACYRHDGQLTKQEVRAMTLAALAPLPGELLWDVGAGCGSISIEWMRSHPRCQAIAIEANSARQRWIAENAAILGTPNLQIIPAAAPAALHALPTPDAIFVGGGLTCEALLETCWTALRFRGRLVANAVTVESEQMLLAWHQRVGGELTRIAIQRAEPIGQFWGWKAMAPVTQWHVIKGA